LGLKLGENRTTDAIALNTKQGIVFGDVAEETMTTILQFYCTNQTVTTPQLALELEMNLQMIFDVAVSNFLITAQIFDPEIANTVTL